MFIMDARLALPAWMPRKVVAYGMLADEGDRPRRFEKGAKQ